MFVQCLRSARLRPRTSRWQSAFSADVDVFRDVSLLHRGGSRRWKTSSKNRWHTIRKRAAEQHVDYLRQMTPPRAFKSVEVDPKLLSRVADTKQIFNMPHVTEQPSVSSKDALLPNDDAVKQMLQPRHSGLLGEASFEHFGSIEVQHGDIFETKADAVVLPMMPSLMPYRGLGLEAFDRGGPDLVKDTFKEAKQVWKTRTEQEEDRTDEGLLIGDTLVVRSRGLHAEHIVFVVMPWFWQGSPLDAAKRYRFCVKAAFRKVVERGFRAIAIPHLGGGVCGYEPQGSCSILMEEAVETMLQVEASCPKYCIQKLKVVDISKDTAEVFNGALTQVAQRWLPDRRLTTAAQYFGNASRRLMVLPDAPNFFWKRHPTKFRRKHGVVRNQRQDWLGRIKPTLWRTQRVRQPPPHLVYKETGEPAPRELQIKPRPYYFRGVSHWLFPSRRSGFHALRKSAAGHWVARERPYHLRDDNRPRM